MVSFACVITVFLFIYVYVLAYDHGILILVNHVVMSKDNRKEVLYYYKEEDLVDVACINFDDQCTIQLEYNFIEKPDDEYKTENMLSLHAVGFRAKLKAANDRSQVFCHCTNSKDHKSITFILKKQLDDVMNVKINGFNLRNLEFVTKKGSLSESNPEIVTYYEAYMDGNITVECNTKRLNAMLYWKTDYERFLSRRDNNRILVKVPIKKTSTLTLITEEEGNEIKEVMIHFRPLRFSLTEVDIERNKRLLMTLPGDNVLMEFYNYEGKQLLYYTFENGDHLPLNCSQPFNAKPQLFIFKSPVEVFSSEGSLLRNIKLNPNYNNTILECYMSENAKEVRAILRHRLPSLVVLVNRFVLSTEGDPKDSSIRTAVYHYGDGDMVDVSCAVTNERCSVELNYDYAEDLHEAFKTADLLSSHIVGFRTKLRVKHNNSNMVCKCIRNKRITILIKLTFVLGNFEHGVHNIFKLKINGMIARQMILYEYSVNKDVPLIYNWASEKLDIEAETNGVNNSLKWYYNDIIRTDVKLRTQNETSMKITLFPSKQILSLHVIQNSDRQDITIHFVKLPLFKPFDLTLNLPKENTIMELYKYPSKQWFYYEYQNDDSLTLICSSSQAMQGMLISFNGTEERCKNSISKEFHLTAADDDTTHECLLKKDANKVQETTGKIIVVFNQRKEYDLMLIIGCSAGIAVFILVICILCCWKIRKIRIEKLNAEMYVNTRVEKTKMKPKFPEPNIPAIEEVVSPCQIKEPVVYANMSVEIQQKMKTKTNSFFPKRPKKSAQNVNIGEKREHVKTQNEARSHQNRKPDETLHYDYVRRSQIIRSIKCRNVCEGQTQNISYCESVKEDVYDYTIGY